MHYPTLPLGGGAGTTDAVEVVLALLWRGWKESREDLTAGTKPRSVGTIRKSHIIFPLFPLDAPVRTVRSIPGSTTTLWARPGRVCLVLTLEACWGDRRCAADHQADEAELLGLPVRSPAYEIRSGTLHESLPLVWLLLPFNQASTGASALQLVIHYNQTK